MWRRRRTASRRRRRCWACSTCRARRRGRPSSSTPPSRIHRAVRHPPSPQRRPHRPRAWHLMLVGARCPKHHLLFLDPPGGQVSAQARVRRAWKALTRGGGGRNGPCARTPPRPAGGPWPHCRCGRRGVCVYGRTLRPRDGRDPALGRPCRRHTVRVRQPPASPPRAELILGATLRIARSRAAG